MPFNAAMRFETACLYSSPAAVDHAASAGRASRLCLSEVRDAAQQTESVAFIGQNQFGDNVVIGTAGEMVPQPSLVKFTKGKICFRLGQ